MTAKNLFDLCVRAGKPRRKKFFGAASIFAPAFRLYGCGGFYLQFMEGKGGIKIYERNN